MKNTEGGDGETRFGVVVKRDLKPSWVIHQRNVGRTGSQSCVIRGTEKG